MALLHIVERGDGLVNIVCSINLFARYVHIDHPPLVESGAGEGNVRLRLVDSNNHAELGSGILDR